MLSLPLGFSRLLVAVSGGADSIALMHLLHKENFKLHIATVNHGLRETNETQFVAQEAAKLGLPCSILTWEGDKPKTGLQEAARHARYELLVTEAKRLNCEAIVTAHTQDDQAETLLMRLLRGTGPKGMAGMQIESEMLGMRLLRPLLWVTKQQLLHFLQTHNFPHCEDPSNQNTAFTRVRMRQFLTQEQVVSERLARLAARQALQNEALETLAMRLEKSLKLKNGLYNLKPIIEEPFALNLTLFQKLLKFYGDSSIHEKLEKCEELVVDILEAVASQSTFHTSLRGAKLSLTPQGLLKIEKAAPRRILAP